MSRRRCGSLRRAVRLAIASWRPHDYPHARSASKTRREQVRLIGAVCARTRLDGVVSGFVRRDGTNSTERMIELVRESQLGAHVQAVLLQGIAVAGFNVVDVQRLAEELSLPVLVLMRRRPRLRLMREALFGHTPGAARKWALIERASGRA